jgi:hypothetical protein
MPTTTAWPVAGCLLDWAGKVSVVEILHGLTRLSAIRFVNLNPFPHGTVVRITFKSLKTYSLHFSNYR